MFFLVPWNWCLMLGIVWILQGTRYFTYIMYEQDDSETLSGVTATYNPFTRTKQNTSMEYCIGSAIPSSMVKRCEKDWKVACKWTEKLFKLRCQRSNSSAKVNPEAKRKLRTWGWWVHATLGVHQSHLSPAKDEPRHRTGHQWPNSKFQLHSWINYHGHGKSTILMVFTSKEGDSPGANC